MHKPHTVQRHDPHPLLASAFAQQHHPRVYQHRLAKIRAIKPSSTHHHHSDLMRMAPLSDDLNSQGIVSSQSRQQAEHASRSRNGLMQWPSTSRHRGDELTSAAASSTARIAINRHQSQEELTSDAEGASASRHRSKDELTSAAQTSASRHRRGELTSAKCHQDMAEELTSAWADEAHFIAEATPSCVDKPGTLKRIGHTKPIETPPGKQKPSSHHTLKHITGFITLLHLHQVWSIHPGSLLDFRLLLHLLLVHQAILPVCAELYLLILEYINARLYLTPASGTSSCHIFITDIIFNKLNYHNFIFNNLDSINFIFYNFNYIKIILRLLLQHHLSQPRPHATHFPDF